MADMCFLTVQQVAEQLQVDVRVVRKWIKDRDLAAIHLGKAYRISTEDFETFLSDRRVAS